MPLTNAENQARWRARLKAKANILNGDSTRIADRLIRELGVAKARRVARSLDNQLTTLEALAREQEEWLHA